MADQKETKRERREIAKQRRMEELRRRQRRAAMRKFWYAGIAVVAVGAIVAAVLLTSKSSAQSTKELNAAAVSAGCTRLQNPPEEGHNHVAAQTRVTYGTNPPTSGNHYQQTSYTGVLPNPLPTVLRDENLVHNMEHGAIEVWYKPDLDPALVGKLTSFVRGDTTRRILVVRSNMDYQVAFTAWTHLIGCTSPNSKIDDVAKKFAAKFQGKGPEGDRPGTPYTG
jgi:Protein of unknown function (DUF3105)